MRPHQKNGFFICDFESIGSFMRIVTHALVLLAGLLSFADAEAIRVSLGDAGNGEVEVVYEPVPFPPAVLTVENKDAGWRYDMSPNWKEAGNPSEADLREPRYLLDLLARLKSADAKFGAPLEVEVELVALLKQTATAVQGRSGGAREELAAGPAYDFGDAPAAYPTVLARDGARHRLVPGPYIGVAPDAEADGVETTNADGDDLAGVADEGEIQVLGEVFPGGDLSLYVPNGSSLDMVSQQIMSATIEVWADFDGNGDWDGAEGFAQRTAVFGTFLRLPVPGSVQPGALYVRVRVSTEPTYSASGEAGDGEVQDLVVTVLPAADVVSVTSDVGDPGELRGLIAANSGGTYQIPKGVVLQSALSIVDDVTIIGDSSFPTLEMSTLVAARGPSDPIAVVGATGRLVLQDLNIVGGRPIEPDPGLQGGGGILNSGEVILINCVVSNCFASTDSGSAAGGAIANQPGGSLLLVDCLFSGNEASGSDHGDGGALYNAGGQVDVLSCMFNNNFASGGTAGRGGAIFSTGGTLRIDARTTFEDNFADLGPDTFGVYDFGDAANNFPVAWTQDGARHCATGVMLGATRDAETDGVPSAAADSDGSDEDGVTFPTLIVGQPAELTVTVNNDTSLSRLNVWADFNSNGLWDLPDEQIVHDLPVTTGPNSVSVDIPGTAAQSPITWRFRVSDDPVLRSYGAASNGEVEDYVVAAGRPAADLVSIGLELVEDVAGAPEGGEPEGRILIPGQEYWLKVYLSSLKVGGAGISAIDLDVSWDPAALQPLGSPLFGPDMPVGQAAAVMPDRISGWQASVDTGPSIGVDEHTFFAAQRFVVLEELRGMQVFSVVMNGAMLGGTAVAQSVVSGEKFTTATLPVLNLFGPGTMPENGGYAFLHVEADRPWISDIGGGVLTGGSAVDGVDYNLLTPSFLIPRGHMDAQIELEAIDDAIFQGSRSIEISLGPAGNAVAGAWAQILLDDDEPPVVQAPEDTNADEFKLLRNGHVIEIWLNGALEAEWPSDSPMAVQLMGSGDDDSLIVDHVTGFPVHPGGFQFDAHGGTNLLQFEAGRVIEATYDWGAGMVSSDGGGGFPIQFSGVTDVRDYREVLTRRIPFAGSRVEATIDIGLSDGDGIFGLRLDDPDTPILIGQMHFGTTEQLQLTFGDFANTIHAGPIDANASPELELQAMLGIDDDVVDGAAANYSLHVNSGAGNDMLKGGSGDDVFSAGPGEDELDAHGGTNVIDGGTDNDVFRVRPGGTNFVFDGGGTDSLEALGFSLLTLDLESLAVQEVEPGSMLQLGTQIEQFSSGPFGNDVTIFGDVGRPRVLDGGGHANSILRLQGDSGGVVHSNFTTVIPGSAASKLQVGVASAPAPGMVTVPVVLDAHYGGANLSSVSFLLWPREEGNGMAPLVSYFTPGEVFTEVQMTYVGDGMFLQLTRGAARSATDGRIELGTFDFSLPESLSDVFYPIEVSNVTVLDTSNTALATARQSGGIYAIYNPDALRDPILVGAGPLRWEVDQVGATLDFRNAPIPPDHMYPGSPAFDGVIQLVGGGLPQQENGSAAVLLESHDEVILPEDGTGQAQVEILDLRLISSAPVQIGDTSFDVQVTLDQGDQSGFLDLYRTSASGGDMFFYLNLAPRALFRTEGATIPVDLGPEMLSAFGASWDTGPDPFTGTGGIVLSGPVMLTGSALTLPVIQAFPAPATASFYRQSPLGAGLDLPLPNLSLVGFEHGISQVRVELSAPVANASGTSGVLNIFNEQGPVFASIAPNVPLADGQTSLSFVLPGPLAPGFYEIELFDVEVQTKDGPTPLVDPWTTVVVIPGDTNEDGNVSGADIRRVNHHSGQPVTLENVRSDVNEDGVIDIGDRLVIGGVLGAVAAPPPWLELLVSSPQIEIAPDTFVAGTQEVDGEFVVDLVLTEAFAGWITVAYTTIANTAIGLGDGPEPDFVHTSGTASFAPGSLRQSLSIPIFWNPGVEAAVETFTFQIRSAVLDMDLPVHLLDYEDLGAR